MLRLFIAIALPEMLRQRLAGLCAGLPGARWVAPENMHLTLRFVGEVGLEQARDIDAALAAVSAPKFDLRLDGVGIFGKPRAARAVWVGACRSDALLRLQRKVEVAVARSGAGPEARKFSPHVTLARLRGVSPTRLERYVVDHAAFQAPPVAVEKFVLYSSDLAASGAIHTVEAEYPLDQ
jgi:2'-5' RNA ligase